MVHEPCLFLFKSPFNKLIGWFYFLPLIASCWDLESMVWLLRQYNDILAMIETLQGERTQHLVHVRITHDYNSKLSAFYYS